MKLQIVSIEQIKNPFLEETYEGMKKLITNNVQELIQMNVNYFMEQKVMEFNGITEDGFDDRYFNAHGCMG